MAGMLRLDKARAEHAQVEAERRLADLERRLAELADEGGLSDIDSVIKSVGGQAVPLVPDDRRRPGLRH